VTPRLRYALLFVIAAVPLVGVGSVKPSPLAVAAAIFVAHGFFSLAGRADDRFLPRDLLSALLLVACLVSSSVVIFTVLALALFPAVTSDGHPVMPIGQAFLGIVVGVVAGAALTYFAALRAAVRDRHLERLVLHAIGAVVIVATAIAYARQR
jgi:hypothetical protein